MQPFVLGPTLRLVTLTLLFANTISDNKSRRTDLLELAVDCADEGDGVSAGRRDSHGRHGAAGPRQSRLPPDGVGAVDRVVHVTFAAVRVVDRERLNTHHDIT